MAEIKYLSKSGLETLAEILATKSWVEGKNYTTASGHNHDGRYYTESEIDTKLATKANVDHDHRLLTSLVPQGTSIPAGADLNSIPYIKVGKYYCSTNANADDIINCPVSSAFMMEVYSPLSTTIDNEEKSTYVYRLRKITHYSTGVQYIQFISSGKTAGEFSYGNWRVVPLAPFTLSTTNASSGTANNGGSAALGSATKGVYVKADGTLAAMTYTLGKSVPSDAVFTDTNTKVTNVGNHYAPEANTASQLSADASSTTAATWGTTSLVTGVNLQRDAAGHVTGITLDSIKMPANPNTNVPLTDSYTGTSTTTAFSQKGANTLYTTLNNKFGSYLPLDGGTLKGNLTMMPSNQHNADQFILFKYSTTDLDDYSWRIGYLGTGSANANYFAIQNNGVGDAWTSVLYFGLTDQIAYFKNTPKVGTTSVSLEGHTHDASAIVSGTLADARIPSLAASKISSGVFDVARIPDMGAAKITSGTLADARIPSLAASKITSGTFDAARIPNLAASKITSGTFNAARIPSLDASKIASGTLDAARIPALNYLSLDGGTLKGPTFNSVLCTGDNLAVYTTTNSTVTGTIKIKLPFTFISSMMMFEIYIYDYSATNGSKIYVSGYNYGSNSTYNNYGCTIIGKYNKKVRLSYDGSNCCILLGNIDSTWNYPQVILKSAFGGFNGKANITKTGYEISVITDETNYTKTVECTNYLKATTVAWADITNKPTAFAAAGHTHGAGDITSGTLSTDRIPNLAASKITSGVLGIDRTPKIAGHGTCDTAASTAAKVVTIADTTWTLKAGSIIGVKFSDSNSASGVTLNVNNTGAKSIYYNNEAYTSSSTSICGYKNRTTYYMYDGTYWVWLGMSYLDGNTDTKVRQYTTDSTNDNYPLLFRYSSAAPSSTYEANYSRYDSAITVNPSTNTITAATFKGNLSGNASSSTVTRYIQCPDTRSVAIVPSEVTATSTGVSFDFKAKSVTGLDSAYSGVMTFRPYSSNSDWSGGPIHQLAFDGNGLHHRTASSDTWGAWKSISYTDHTHNYAPASHNHDDRYYTETEVNNLLAGKAASSHGNHVTGGAFTSGNQNDGSHDCNAIKSNGHWYYSSNGPATSLGATTNDGALYTQAYSDRWVAQIAQDYRDGDLFTRGLKDGTWTAWKAVSYNGHIHAASDITSGTFDIARIPTGTTASTVSLGNHTHSFSNINPGNAIIGDGANYMAFRSTEAWRSGMYYHTNGDEAMVFANKNSRSSWMFVYDDPASRPLWTEFNGTTKTVPSLQIRNQCVTINKLMPNTGSATSWSYNLDVGGKANATELYENGTRVSVVGHTHNGSTIINELSEGTSPAQRNDYIVAQYAGGGTTTTSYHRRKLSNIFAALNKSDITTALGYTPPTTDTAAGKTFKTGISTAIHSGWDNATNQDKIIPTMNFIAYWNGAYNSSNSSNLTYSANGTIIGSNNYTSYTVKKDGTGSSGTWGINITGSAGSVAWDNITGKPSTFAPSSHEHTYIKSKDNYTFTSSTLPNSFDLGISAGFVSSDSGFGNYGSVLTVRTYSGGGGTLQLYAPYSNTYGGSRLKARFGNYDSSNGNSWTTLKEVAWTSDIPTNNNQLTNGAGYITGITKSMVTTALGYTPPTENSWRGITNVYDTTNPSTSTSLSQSGANALYNAVKYRQHYSINLESLSTSNFYPIYFEPSDFETDCEIHSPNVGGNSAWNQNYIHFLLTAQGWSDTAKNFIILSHGVYETPEITIGAIGYGVRSGAQCVWLRGGLKYRMLCNKTPKWTGSTVTYNDEVYSVGTNYSGGTNTYVTIAWKYGDSTGKITTAGHTHDDRYYTETEVNNLLAGKAASSHGNHVPETQTANNAKFLRNDNTWQTVTPANIGAATASHGNHVPATQTANNAKFLRNDNTWQTVTPANIGAATASHGHSTLVCNYLLINRSAATSSGISFYADAYRTWQIYMSDAGTAGSGTKGNITPPVGNIVKTWALRSVIENQANYGWTWESMPEGTTAPSIIMELSSNTGALAVYGKVSASGGFFDSSDERLKDFYDDIEVDFDKLRSIPKKYFTWKTDDKNEIQIGTSAQAVKEVYPELVSEDGNGNLSVAYNKLSVISLKAIDKLHEENVELKTKLETIEQEKEELKSRLDALEDLLKRKGII